MTSTDEMMKLSTPISIDRVQAFALSVRPSVGPVSSLGDMPVRNGLLIALTTSEGVTGWGEIWCNFPPRGNLARLNLLEDVIAPQLIGAKFSTYDEGRVMLEQKFARMALHTGEFGPFAHCLSGIDTALADIASKDNGVPLHVFLGGQAKTHVPVYASTPNVAKLENSINDIIAAGHKGLKLKIGHGLAKDIKLLMDVKEIAGDRLSLMVDANQNWPVQDAIETVNALSQFSLDFVEEPLPADAPLTDWAELAQAVKVPLAGGENITSLMSFRDFLDKGRLGIVQPDVAKWGGVSGAFAVGQIAKQSGATCAMHYMGTGLGLAASVHVLAAIDGKGRVELDANPNPLRTDLGKIDLTVSDGLIVVADTPGHGFSPDPSAINSMAIGSIELST